MLAVTSHGEHDIRVEEVPKPSIEASSDAIVRVTTAALCGSDLHIYHGKIPQVEPGWVIGHEFCGVVDEIGDGVIDLEPGDRVVASMQPACGRCEACVRGEHRRCPAFGVFGYGRLFGNLQGSDAEFVRVPFADMTLRRIPEGLDDEATIFSGDLLATAFTALKISGVSEGDTIAVVGCGPVGQFIAMCAPIFGVARIYAIDPVEERLQEAAAFGAIPINPATENPRERIVSETGDRADKVFEAAGNVNAIEQAFKLTRENGDLVLVGMLVSEKFPFSAGDMWLRNINIVPVLGAPFPYREEILKLIVAGRLQPQEIISDRLPLTDAPEAFRAYAAQEVTKVIFEVSR